MNKNLILKIVLSLIAIVIIVVTINFLPKSEENGQITIVLKEQSGEIIESRRYVFTKDDTFYEIINKNYDIVMGTGTKSGMLLKINNLDVTTTSDYYIKILVNDRYSNYGVMNLPLNDGDTITFILEKIR